MVQYRLESTTPTAPRLGTALVAQDLSPDLKSAEREREKRARMETHT